MKYLDRVSINDIIKDLNLKVVYMPEGKEYYVTSQDLNRTGLQFAGYFEYFAYERLQILFEDALNKEDMGYVNLRINKCYIKYLKNLYFSYYNRPESHDIKELIVYIQFLSDSESENISKFTTLSERTKLSILSYI